MILIENGCPEQAQTVEAPAISQMQERTTFRRQLDCHVNKPEFWGCRRWFGRADTSSGGTPASLDSWNGGCRRTGLPETGPLLSRSVAQFPQTHVRVSGFGVDLHKPLGSDYRLRFLRSVTLVRHGGGLVTASRQVIGRSTRFRVRLDMFHLSLLRKAVTLDRSRLCESWTAPVRGA